PEKPRYVDYARVLDEVWRARLNDAGDRESCTTQFSVVDRQGSLCAVTQTNLSIFGSRVVSPATGVLLNNGIMWFDPEPGKANSLRPADRKSTRLNSSHLGISYAVFCLKKKKATTWSTFRHASSYGSVIVLTRPTHGT